ncbi:hypothetical protein [Myxococcus sp. RHSTA-1-4]|uniref:hypothetical protein n=1 Tax=Myxococcus sp. RHSTA-1-4 TaxID=2874601 RepID=UPI001CBEC5C1|nr:hypothetical protein [Myxococcus sp. RHSTA-1-4]MBZ4422562.1 hypothetical protein [Myxococcus sp. RHSTA-1-4]
MDHRDVAEVAAIALTEDRLAHGTFELSTCVPNREEIAALMSQVLGRRIEAAEPDSLSDSCWSLPWGRFAASYRSSIDWYDLGHRGVGIECSGGPRAVLVRERDSAPSQAPELHVTDLALGVPLSERIAQQCGRDATRCALWLEARYGEKAPFPSDHPQYEVLKVGEVVDEMAELKGERAK